MDEVKTKKLQMRRRGMSTGFSSGLCDHNDVSRSSSWMYCMHAVRRFIERIKVGPTGNVLNAVVSREQEHFQWTSECLSTVVRVSYGTRKTVPDCRANNRERPTSIQVEPVAKSDQLMTERIVWRWQTEMQTSFRRDRSHSIYTDALSQKNSFKHTEPSIWIVSLSH